MPSTEDFCGHCLHQSHQFTHLIAIDDYHPPYSTFIKQFKYHRDLIKGEVLAKLLLQQIKKRYTPTQLQQVNCLIAVPLHRKKLQQRGFNQAAILAKYLSTHLQIPTLDDALIRNKATQPQEGLTLTARHKNLNKAFIVPAHYLTLFQDKHIVIIDDVVTTGATVNSMCSTLNATKPTQIDVWCLCRTDLPSQK